MATYTHMVLNHFVKVIGNMAEAMGAASPALKSAVIQCINQPAASTEVQQAAIQVFRLTPIPEEVYCLLPLTAKQHSS